MDFFDDQLQEYEVNSQRFSSFMKLSGLLALASNSMAVYLILFKSSEHMHTYRFYLLAIVVRGFDF